MRRFFTWERIARSMVCLQVAPPRTLLEATQSQGTGAKKHNDQMMPRFARFAKKSDAFDKQYGYRLLFDERLAKIAGETDSRRMSAWLFCQPDPRQRPEVQNTWPNKFPKGTATRRPKTASPKPPAR